MVKKYFSLLLDNFLSSLILPVHQGFVFKAMLYFKDHYSIAPILFYGVTGSCLGGIANWFLGRAILYTREIINRLLYSSTTPYTENLYYPDRNSKHKILHILIICAVALFSWIPGLGSLIQVIVGYLKLNIYIFTLMIFLSYFIQSLYFVLTT